MRPQVVTVGPLAAASATNIRTASAIGGAGAVVLNGSTVVNGVAILDKPRQVLFTFAADETGKSFVVSGTGWSDQVIGETVLGTTPGTVATKLDYKTFGPVIASGASAGNVSIGTNGIAGSPWVQFNGFDRPEVGIQLDVTGTVNATLQNTMDDPNGQSLAVAPASVTWFPCGDAAAVGFTADVQTNYAFAPIWSRVLLNSGTGSVRATFQQYGG